MKRSAPIWMTVLAASLLTAAAARAAIENDYPTSARADYVFACMASNGQTQEMLNRCSCSIDAIASVLSYDQYVEAETIMRMRLIGGEKTAMFRGSKRMKQAVGDLKRAQAEAEILCF